MMSTFPESSLVDRAGSILMEMRSRGKMRGLSAA
jgi:hypothetical protein